MGTLTGQQIVDRAWIKAQDTNGGSGTRWPASEALLWINDAQREIVNLLPKANPKVATPTLTNTSRQTFTGLSISDGVAILDVVQATATGQPITLRPRAWFDDQLKTWHTATGVPYHWMYDDRDPGAFYVWPHSAVAVELVYGALPADLGSLASTISLSDIYANALQYFVLHSFYSKGATYTKNPQLAAQYWTMFQQCLGFRDKAVRLASVQAENNAAGRSEMQGA